MVVFVLCLPHTHSHITLTFHYAGETIEMYKKRGEVYASGGLKYWCDCEVNGSKIWVRGWKWELWGEWARRRGEDITCKAGLWGAWVHNQWSEVCVVSVVSSQLHRSQSYFYREVRSVAMLFEKVSCSLKKSRSIHSGVVSHLQSGQKKKEQLKWRELLLLGDRFNWLLMIWSIRHSKERVDTSRNRLCTYSFLFKQRCECGETHIVWQKKRCIWWEGLSIYYVFHYLQFNYWFPKLKEVMYTSVNYYSVNI